MIHELVDREAGRGVVGAHDAADAAPDHRGDRNPQLLEPAEDADVRRSAEPSRAEDDGDLRGPGRLHAVILLCIEPPLPRDECWDRSRRTGKPKPPDLAIAVD